MSKIKISALEHVEKHWGTDAPQWIIDLAKACDKTSQKAMASKIGKSPAVINLVLKNNYVGGRIDRVEADVKRILDARPVDCPILGLIEASECISNQKLPFNGGNHQQVKLFVACRKCPHNSKNQGDNS